MLKAFLLSAGLGTRLRPLTDEIPKCLLPVRGKPLLQIWLELLSKHDVDEVLINTHWHHGKVEEYLKSRKNTVGSKQGAKKGGPKIRLFYEQDLLGSAGTILANRDWVSDDEPFFILYGDNLTDVNLSKMLSFHCQHALPFTLGLFRTKKPKECGIAEIGADNVVNTFVEKPDKPTSDLAAAGIYIADPSVFDFFPEKKETAPAPLDLGHHIIPQLAGNMKAYFIPEFLMDIGTPESYQKAQALWKTQITPRCTPD